MSIKAILFDLHGTLVRIPPDNLEERYRSAYDTLVPLGMVSPYEHFRHIAEDARVRSIAESEASLREGQLLDRMLFTLERMEFGQGVDPARAAQAAADSYVRVWIEELFLHPGVRECLDRLKPRYRLGLVTNYQHTPAIPRILNRFDLQDLFDAVVVSAEFGWRKPHPSIFEHTLQILGVVPQKAIFVGDDLSDDTKGAAGAGIQPVLFDPSGTHGEYNGTRVASFSDLEATIKEIDR